MDDKELQIQIQYSLVEKLAESEQRYRELVENLDEVVFTVDKKGQIVFLNRSWVRILGYTRAESIGCLISDFLHPEDRQVGLTSMTQSDGKNLIVSQELRFYSLTSLY